MQIQNKKKSKKVKKVFTEHNDSIAQQSARSMLVVPNKVSPP